MLAFDIVEFYRSSSISISPAKYLRLNPKELDKLVQYVKGGPVIGAKFTDNMTENMKASGEPIVTSDRYTENNRYRKPTTNVVDRETKERKPNPFYVSLLLN